MKNMAKDNLELLKEAFMEWLKVKGFTIATRKSYRIYVGKFMNYLNEENIESVADITPTTVFNYQTALYYAESVKGKPLSVLTQHNALVVVKTFFSFLIETDKLTTDPSSGIKLPKKPKTLPDAMTLEEIELLLEQPDVSTVMGFRNRTIMEVLYATGMRNGEMCSIGIYDVSLSSEEIHIRHGKGGKDRIVPMGEIACAYVQEYIKMIRPKLVKNHNEQALFLSRTGKKMNIVDVMMMVRGYVQKANLHKHITPHTFRHTCATHMLQGGADIRYIQTLLGHESITSTQIYTHVEIADLKAVHKQFHPREKANV